MKGGVYSVYILRCADGSFYTGIAVDVERRVAEHRDGARGSRYVRSRLPATLVFECPAGTRAAAQRLEHRLKSLSRPQKEALVAGRLLVESLGQASGAGAG